MSNRPLMLVPTRLDRGYPGGREIDRFRGLENAVDDTRPEAWVGSTTYTYHHTTDSSSTLGLAEVYTVSGEKQFLKDVIAADPVGYLGQRHVETNGPDLAVLVKLLDAQKQLGLQAHPDREFARRMFSSPYGKVESWYVIGTRTEQEEQPYVLLGFKEGVTRKKFQELFLSGNVAEMEKCCHKIPVAIGDMYFVDGGVPHAIGPGCFVVEVQEPSDITVGARMRHFADSQEERLFIERTMGCYHYVGRSYEDNLATYQVQPTVLGESEGGTETLLLGPQQTPFFSITRLDVRDRTPVRDTGTFCIAIVLAGKGELSCKAGSAALKQGDELFLPAGMEDPKWQADGDLQVVCCHPPGVSL